MQHSEAPVVELERARQAIQAMRDAQNLEDFEEFWKEYLRRLERTWNKAVNHFGKSPKWNGWQGRFLKLRKDDELLSYLINARGADEHTVAAITERQEAEVGVRMGPRIEADGSRVAYIEKLEIRGGKIVKFKGDNVRLHFLPSKVKLLEVKNRGVVYRVPTVHLSQPINSEDLLSMAERGVSFYADFLAQAEEFFISSAVRKG